VQSASDCGEPTAEVSYILTDCDLFLPVHAKETTKVEIRLETAYPSLLQAPIRGPVAGLVYRGKSFVPAVVDCRGDT
jgi:hypothetical protein